MASNSNVDYFSLTPYQQQAYLNGDPNYMSAGAPATTPDDTSSNYNYNPYVPPSANPTPPSGATAVPFGSGTSVVPNASTYQSYQQSLQSSPFMTPAALANQAVVGAAGDPMFGQNVTINGTQVPWNSLDQNQQAMYQYFMGTGQGLPNNFMSAYAGPNSPWNQTYNQMFPNGLPSGVANPATGTLTGTGQPIAQALIPSFTPTPTPATLPRDDITKQSILTAGGLGGRGGVAGDASRAAAAPAPAGPTMQSILSNPRGTDPRFGALSPQAAASMSGGSGTVIPGAPGSTSTSTGTNMLTGPPGGYGVSPTPNPFTSPTGGTTNALSFSGLPGGYGSTTFSPPGAGTGGGGGSADQTLANNAGSFFNPLQQMAAGAGAGAPIDTTNQWQAMVAAMQRPEQEAQANLAEQLNVGGGRFSTGFGTAMTDLLTQQGLQEQSLLAQMQVPAMEQAQQIQAGAGTQLGGFGQQALSQLSSQNFQSQMQQYAAAIQAAQQAAGLTGGAATQLAQGGAQGADALLQGSITGAQGLFGAENTGALANMQNQFNLLGLGNTVSQGLDTSWMQNLGLGGQLGGQQYGLQQQQLSNLYQQWMSQQPWANPMLQYLMGAATGIPSLSYPQYQPGALGGLMGGLGGLLGSLPGLAMMSDIRIKDVRKVKDTPLGRALGLDAYEFSYLWEPDVERTGFIAQEVEEKYPWAVETDYSGLKRVDYGKLAEAAMLLDRIAA